MSLASKMINRRRTFDKYRRDFERLFERPLADYEDIQGAFHLGLDIVKLDEDLHGSIDYTGTEFEGMSMAEAIEQKYGEEAVEIVRILM